MILPVVPEFIKQLGLAIIYHDDFCRKPLSTVDTTLAADSGATVTNAGTAGGNCLLTTGATDNNEAAIATSPYLIATGVGNNLVPVRVASISVRVPDFASNQATVAISSAAAMGLSFYAKAGSANTETPVIDYWSVYGVR